MTTHEGFGDMLVWLSVLTQRRYAQICADHDLTPAQGQLLCTVKDQPRRMAEVAAALSMAKSALSQLVDRTERRGLVLRETPQQDRRGITLGVTAEGKKIAEALYADVARRLPDIADDLSADDQRHLERVASAIVAGHLSTLANGTCPC